MRYFLLIILSISMLSVNAQRMDSLRTHSFKQYVPQEELDKFNLRQMQINKRGMLVLSGWGVGNVLYGSIAASLTHDEQKYFHMTNAIWGGINTLIAVPSLVASFNKTRMLNMSFGKTVLQQNSSEKLYLINGALDVAYIGAGAAMWGFSDKINKVKVRQGVSGAGKAFMAQGAFLLFFDWTMYIVHSQHAHKALNKYTAGLAYTGTGFSYNLEF